MGVPTRSRACLLAASAAIVALCGCGFGRHEALWTTRTHAPLNERFVVAKDCVAIADLADDRASLLSCFGTADGTLRWQVPLDEYFDLNSAVAGLTLAADPDGSAVYVAQGTMMASHAAADGRQRWVARVPPTEPFEDFTIGHTPVVVGERLYLLSRHSRLVAIDRSDGTLAFRTDDMESADDLAIRGGVAITLSLEAHDVRAHDAASGRPLWQRPIRPQITNRLGTSIRLAPDDGTYLVVDSGRALLSLEARTGALRWEQPVVGLVSYAVAGGVVVATDAASTRGLDAGTGAVRWSHPTGGHSLVAPLDGTTVLLVAPPGVATVDASTGSVRRYARHGLHEQDGVLDAREGLVVITTDNGVARLYRRVGARLIERKLTVGMGAWRWAPTFEQAVVTGGSVVAFNTSHQLQRFRP